MSPASGSPFIHSLAILLPAVLTMHVFMQAAKREKHAETGSECEHGIWRCRICNPPQKARR